jgi:protein SCO1/2
VTAIVARTRRVSAVLLVATVVAVFAGCGGKSDSTAIKGVRRDPALAVDGASLPDAAHGNARFTFKAARGHLLLVYFGYTFCPDVCPTTLSDISVALRKIGRDRAQSVDVAMVTVDLERDSGKVLHSYLRHFFASSHALVATDQAQLTVAERAFGVRVEIPRHAKGAAYEVSHTAETYVVNDQGLVVVQWPFGFATDDMASDLKVLLKEAQS